MSKRRIIAILAGGLLAALIPFTTASAAFNQNDVMDDVIFDNSTAMNAQNVDTFLNTFSSSCISTNSGFTANDITGYTPAQGFTYGSPVSAGKVITHAAQAYGLNPQVLIATLQKEEGVIDGSGLYGCSDTALASAVGYGCTDSGTNTHNYTYPSGGLLTPLYYRNGTPSNSISNSCVNSGPKTGFSEQIVHAAWLLKFGEQRSVGNINWAVVKTTTTDLDGASWSSNWDNSDDPQSCYSGPMTQGTWQVCPSGGTAPYDGYTTIDSVAVHMDSGATAALYWYTPHFHGNQVFQSTFNQWFGTTVTGGFVWQPQGQNQYADSSLSTPVSPGSLIAGQRYYLTVSVKNVGSQTWHRGNVDLGTSQPNDRQSPFFDQTWLAPNRSATLNEASVAPGQTGTFSFWVHAPNTPGSYKEYFNLVAEGVTWMNDMGLYFGLTVNPAVYSWQPVSQAQYTDETKTIPMDTSSLGPGISTYNVVTIRNSGNVTWYRGAVDLGASQPKDRSSSFARAWLKPNRPATLNEGAVAPGQTGTFEFWTIAPSTTGAYREYFDPVAEGIGWMNDMGMYFPYTVNPPSYHWQPVAQAAYTDQTETTAADLNNLAAGTRYFLTVTAKNNGNQVWRRGRIDLGTSQPQDRQSSFHDASWLGLNRPASIDQDWVNPGQTTTFGFWVQTPSTPGTHKEYFNLVAEDITWMNDMGLYFQLNVQ